MSNAVIPGQAGTSKPKRSKSTPAPARTRKAQAKPATRAQTELDPAAPATGSADERLKMIAEEAYLRAERRGFTQGDPMEDWLAAEREVDERLGSA